MSTWLVRVENRSLHVMSRRQNSGASRPMIRNQTREPVHAGSVSSSNSYPHALKFKEWLYKISLVAHRHLYFTLYNRRRPRICTCVQAQEYSSSVWTTDGSSNSRKSVRSVIKGSMAGKCTTKSFPIRYPDCKPSNIGRLAMRK